MRLLHNKNHKTDNNHKIHKTIDNNNDDDDEVSEN